ncbi:hypothetical protein UFOVP724_89 [uncultured Caudovirales phage]|jgi:hypothetical protein|uniref:Uncharacterized protein n=1 Tax=uncultured Caudovirales phage TaxID=2100421 RepID=A0A6J5NSR0_9CAUD|nr:hypothetical protein UFOVP724_89 [uncultured Caudovirales phage]
MMKISEQDVRLYNMIMDVPLPASHPRYKVQKQFFEFQKEYPLLKVETADLYNNGGYVSIHFDKDEFNVLCDMDDMTIEFAILIDYEEASFETIDKIPFNWDTLRSRLNDMQLVAPWTETFDNEDTEELARAKTIEHLNKKWNSK